MKIMKRLLAVLLCASMLAGIGLPEISSKAEGSVTEKRLYDLNGKEYSLCYEDDFETGETYAAALGSYASNQFAMPWDEENQRLYFPSDTVLTAGTAVFNGLTNASSMQNYTVSAEVTPASTSQYTALIAYGTGTASTNSTTGYEFVIVGGQYFRLNYRVNGTYYAFDGLEMKHVKNAGLGITDNAVGKTITISLSAVTNAEGNVELTCYAAYNGTEVNVFTYTADVTKTGITSGAPGFRTHDKGTTIDNVSVICEKEASDAACLYADDFEHQNGYIAALGDNISSSANLVWKNGTLGIESTNETKVTKVSILKGLSNYESLTDYTVAADFTFGANETGYNGVMAYGSGSGTTSYGYEFAVVNNTFRLYRRSSANARALQQTGSVTNFFGDYEPNDVIRLSMTAVTNYDTSGVPTGTTLICRAVHNGIERIVFQTTDTDSDAIFCGTAGLRGQCVKSTVDNICVMKYTVETDDTEALFTEGFDNEIKTCQNWGMQAQKLNITGDKATLDECLGQMYLDNDKAAAWSDSGYIYEADVTMTNTVIATSDGKTVSIVAAANSDMAGYEFGLVYSTSGQSYSVRLYDRINNIPCKTVSYKFNGGPACETAQLESVKLKMVVRKNKINCYVNGECIIEYEAPAETVFTGTIGLKVGGVAGEFDNLRVISIPDNYVDISEYRDKTDVDVYADHPVQEGYVFGGWYTDAGCTMPLSMDVMKGDAYVRWVDEKVLTVKAQLSTDMYQEVIPEKTSMRLVTSVDINEVYDYQNVGFKISTSKHTQEYITTTVFKEIRAKNATLEFNYTPGESFETDAASFFATVVLNNLDTSDLNKEFTITAFWTTEDGTKVYGNARTLTMQEGINAGKNE